MRKREIAVSFLVVSQEVSAEEIAQRLQLDPSSSRKMGEDQGTLLEAKSNVWEYFVEFDPSEALEDVVIRTLRALDLYKDKLRALRDVAELVVWCAVFSNTPQTTVSLSPVCLAAISEFGATFDCKVYATDFED